MSYAAITIDDREFETSAFTALRSDETGDTRTWGDAVSEILKALSLEDDWDGMGAGRLERGIATVFPDVLRRLKSQGWAPPTSVRPTPDGCVALEWLGGDNGRVEVEISSDRIEWIVINPGGVQTETEYL